MSAVLCDPKLCTGCGACYSACPCHSIEMIIDAEGFLRPYIDTGECLDCGTCTRACPVLHPLPEIAVTDAQAAYACDEEIRRLSSSGGIFTICAEEILAQGGVVFGAAFTSDFKRVRHIAVTKPEALHLLRGSKYIQSDTADSYSQVKVYLQQGIPVYYAGTPCQITGLKQFLGEDFPLLITQDVVCHGVPSPGVWQDYLMLIEKNDDSLSRFSFRDKTHGWENFGIRMITENGDVKYQSQSQNLFMRGFLQNLYLRPSCYACPVKNQCESSDLTLGDLWGIRHILPEWKDDRGVSLVLIRSEKGKRLMETVSAKIIQSAVDITVVQKYNSALLHSVQPPPIRHLFFQNRESGMMFSDNVSQLCPIPLKTRVLQFLPKNLKRAVKQFIR